MEYDNWRQDRLNESLSAAIRADSVDRVKKALESGADIHAWEGYCLTLAQCCCKNWSDESTLRLISDAMFDATAFSAIVGLNGLGFSDSEITKTLRATYANKKAVASVVAELPNDIG